LDRNLKSQRAVAQTLPSTGLSRPTGVFEGERRAAFPVSGEPTSEGPGLD
ncbi:Hypothetical predicted protein, partial [Cloeon dipterum]